MSASATATTTERKSFLPLRVRSTTVAGSSNMPASSRSITPVPISMPLGVQNDSKVSFAVGDRVLVNGLKIGTLRYVGTVKFASGLFYGIELDEPEGKHDGQVNDFRYFQCKTNHGVFVPYDKVVLAPRERTLSTYRTISRLRPPAITRTMTVSSAITIKTERHTIKPPSPHIPLPDIIPTPTTPTQPIAINKSINDPVLTDDLDTMTPTEEPSLICNSILQIQPTIIDEPSETIEADFTDSVSLILHQLQQDEKPDFLHSRGSLTISEGSTNDDGDDENDDNISDDCDNESIPGSSISERIQIIRRSLSIHESTKSVQTDLSFDINDNMLIMKNTSLESTSLSNSNKSLTDSSTSINKLKMNSTYNKSVSSNKRLSIPTSISTIKKDSERKGSITVINTASSTRKLSLIPSKKGSPAMTRQNSINSIVSSSSQSKLNHSLSSTTSIDDNHTEVIPNSRRSSNTNLKSSSTTTRKVSHPTNLLDSDKKPISSQHLSLQKSIIQSFEDQSRKQYQHLLKQFDTLCIMSQYYHSQNEQIKQHYELQLKKVQTASNQLKISIDQLQTSHQNELSTLEQQHRNQLDTIKELHQQQIIEYQQNLDKASNEKIEFEIRCKSLQEQVDRFMDEMANSEHADPLLRRVEILEKDRTSLQTVLEIRKQELTQLRTKINEQVFQREDQLALQKRIDMVENRNQDLVCLLRNWQLNEKAIAVERDQLKEQIAILERDNRQLTFQNETLLYRLRDRPISTSQPQSLKLNLTAPIIPPSRDRTHSLSTLMITNIHKTDCLSRSLSLNFL